MDERHPSDTGDDHASDDYGRDDYGAMVGDALSAVERETPPPDDARERVDRLRQFATLLDDAIRIPGVGYRVGIDPIVGLLPVGGDLTTAALSAVVVAEAWRMGAPGPLLARMAVNIAVDTLAGSVPLVGDAFDAAWKANMRNVDLLEEWVEGRTGPSSETL